MLTWATLGTTAGAVVVVHAVLYLSERVWPRRNAILMAIVSAEVVTCAYGTTTRPLTWPEIGLWVVNGLVVAAIALGGLHVISQVQRSGA